MVRTGPLEGPRGDEYSSKEHASDLGRSPIWSWIPPGPRPQRAVRAVPSGAMSPRKERPTMTGTAKGVAVAAVFAGAIALVGAGCSREEGKGPAETLGKKIDAATDATKNAA